MADPAVVALGGGHGLAVVLRAVRRYTASITAVVSVADDGGSSGRLRRDLGVLPPGDIRRCLVALASDDSLWAGAFEHRFAEGELEGHALGNLVLVGLADALGSFPAALKEAGRLLRTVGRVVPATTEPVVLKAELGGSVSPGRSDSGMPDSRMPDSGTQVEGQVAVAASRGIRRVALVPEDPPAPAEALSAIAGADQVVLAPGSLYTSLLPVLCVPTLRDAIATTPARVVQVANLRPQVPETAGLDATDHLRAVLDHGARVDVFLYQEGGTLAVDVEVIRSWGVEPVAAAIAAADEVAHDPERLAKALHALL